jgi:hypothetical protein
LATSPQKIASVSRRYWQISYNMQSELRHSITAFSSSAGMNVFPDIFQLGHTSVYDSEWFNVGVPGEQDVLWFCFRVLKEGHNFENTAKEQKDRGHWFRHSPSKIKCRWCNKSQTISRLFTESQRTRVEIKIPEYLYTFQN